ncbi:hypothetical protein [Agromyces laixinhei]|uniref:hypothetical protein n=1 Tax=Agromyces laixinhei TaxID=2585717 RepID=UPI0011166D8E|nr:hypothetical protein [Agromyces laixinhei]
MSDIDRNIDTAKATADAAKTTVEETVARASDAVNDTAQQATEAAADAIGTISEQATAAVSTAKDATADGVAYVTSQYRENPGRVIAIGAGAVIAVGVIIAVLRRR